MALAAAWQPAIDDAALAALQARALELGVRDGAARALALREQVLDELALLLARADGERPRAPMDPLAEALVARTREHELGRLKASLAAFDADRVGPSPHPLAAWERWLGLRAAWERAEQHAGRAALATLWRTGLRDRLWGYCCAVSHAHGPRGRVGQLRDVRLARRSRRGRRRSGRGAREPGERPHRAGSFALVAPRRRRGVRLSFFQVAAIARFARGRLGCRPRISFLMNAAARPA